MTEQAQINWVGDAKEVLSAFPHEIKGVFGYSLRRLQKGLLPDCDARRMESVGKGVWELKTADAHLVPDDLPDKNRQCIVCFARF